MYSYCNLFGIDMSKNNTHYPILEKLFNSRIRIKVLKFLFRNHTAIVGVRDLARRIQEPYNLVKEEMTSLEKIGLIKKKT